MAKGHFDIKNVSQEEVIININGVIGDWYDGNDSASIVSKIEQIPSTDIKVYIQSRGGSAFEGIAIYNAFKNHPAKVTTYVLGAAASAASIIFMSGDERVMPDNTFLMIHEPALEIYGKAKELREAAEFLDAITTALLSTYGPYVNIDETALLELIVAESWMKAEDCLKMGFATTLAKPLKAVALSKDFNNCFNELPDPLNTSTVADRIATINNVTDLERALRESGCSKALATALVGKAKQLLSESVQQPQNKELIEILNSFTLN